MRKVLLWLFICTLLGTTMCRASDRMVILIKKNDANVPFWVSRGKRSCYGGVGCHEQGWFRIDSCMSTSCMKKAVQDDLGPFWANRGKKDKIYRQEPLYVEEPKWTATTEDYDTDTDYLDQPFYNTRGKKKESFQSSKESRAVISNEMRDRRFLSDNENVPFQAARGKKGKQENSKTTHESLKNYIFP